MVTSGSSFDADVILGIGLTLVASVTSFCVSIVAYKCFCGRYRKGSSGADDVLGSIQDRDAGQLERLRHNSNVAGSTPMSNNKSNKRDDIKQLRKHSVYTKQWLQAIKRPRIKSFGLNSTPEVEVIRQNIQPEVVLCKNGRLCSTSSQRHQQQIPTSCMTQQKSINTLSLSNDDDDKDDGPECVLDNDVVAKETDGCQVQLIISYHRIQQTLMVNIVKLFGINALTNRSCSHSSNGRTYGTTTGTTSGTTFGTTPGTKSGIAPEGKSLATSATLGTTRRLSFKAVVAAAVAAKNATDLTTARNGNNCDSSYVGQLYVGLTVLPDKDKCLVTTARKTESVIVWNELFNFGGYREDQLTSRSLQLQVFQADERNGNEPIGFALIPLCHVDLSTTQTLLHTISSGTSQSKLGELLLSLCYQPTIGRVTVVVVKARQLADRDRKQSTDPYVKIWLLNNGKKVEKRKTSVKERTTNPVYNESFIFSLPTDRVRLASLTFCVADHRTIGHNPVIGQLTLGSRSGPAEVRHWNEVFEKARQPVAQWHRLKTLQ